MYTLIKRTLLILIGIIIMIYLTAIRAHGSPPHNTPGNKDYPVKVTLYDHYSKTSSDGLESHYNFNPILGGNLNNMGCNKSISGMVSTTLDPEGVPIGGISNECTFSTDLEKWFTGDADHLIEKERVIEIEHELIFAAHTNGNSPGFYHYIDADFYPLDNSTGTLVDMGIEQQTNNHNLGFTMHIQTWFIYESDEQNLKAHFTGGDDFWIFIDGQLVLDQGGMKSSGQKHNIDVQSLVGNQILHLFEGQKYNMDIFFAKRHTHNSNFNLGIHKKMINQTREKRLVSYQIFK